VAPQAIPPAKLAGVVLRVAEMNEAPLRLLLGTDAVTYAERAAQARAAADVAWRALSLSTDDEHATAASLDPLGHGDQ
jgi:hypothetical protein